jgi:hypothetical protein
MPASYKKINYALRPAKQVERKMMCEAFRRLAEFGAMESYRYIGFGSPYFTDFQMVHKHLNVQDMVCIEVNESDRDRFRFNQPFRCIELRFGHSNTILPQLHWHARSIVWLDYDGPIDAGVLTDIGFVCTGALSGSVVAVSVNVDSPFDEKDRCENVKQAVGADRFPAIIEVPQPVGTPVTRPITDADLAGWRRAGVVWRIIRNEIEEVLTKRNGGRSQWHKMAFQQLFHFHYADGAKMLTVGGLLFDRGQEAIMARCAFNTLPFVRAGADAYKIETPLLTYRELRHLDAQLPVDDPTDLEAPGVPPTELKRYAATYRWFPTFAESEL